MRRTRFLKYVAVTIGSVFVIVGLASFFGDASEAAPGYRTHGLSRLLKLLDGTVGSPWTGLILIAAGLVLGGLLYRQARR